MLCSFFNVLIRVVFDCSSPHLVEVRERIRINGQPIGKELFTKYFWQVYGRLEETSVRQESFFIFMNKSVVIHITTQKQLNQKSSWLCHSC